MLSLLPSFCLEVMKDLDHFLLECPLFEEARYILLNKLREQLGLQDPSVYTLLGYEGDVELPNWRDLICEETGQYIERTERFKETQDQKLVSQYFFPHKFYFRTLFDICIS